MPWHFIDISGKRFGKLTAVSYEGQDESKIHNRLWLCKCECGNTIIVAYRHLSSGHTASCGCAQRASLKAGRRSGGWNKLSEGESSFNSLYVRIRASAKQRGYCFHITKPQFRTLTQCCCYYCGQPPSQVSKTNGAYGVYLYNGLDRVNNKLGYTIDNVRPCCKVCNIAKSTLTEEEFFQWINRIAAHTRERETKNKKGGRLTFDRMDGMWEKHVERDMSTTLWDSLESFLGTFHPDELPTAREKQKFEIWRDCKRSQIKHPENFPFCNI